MIRLVGTTPFRLETVVCFSRPIVIAILFLLMSAGQRSAAAATPAHVKVGLFVTQLFDFDMAGSTYAIQFWMWFLHADPNYKPIESVEIVNAKTIESRFTSTSVKERIPWQGTRANVHWDQGRYTTTILKNWDIRNYPFDRQVLDLYIEDGQADSSQVIFDADVANSRIDSRVEVPGWKIRGFSIHQENRVYDTNYGDPTLQGTSIYSRVVVEIDVQRKGVRLLFTAFSGFFVAFLLVTLTYLMDIVDLFDARVGLCAGAIFATIGNKLIVDTSIPPASTFTLSDGIQAVTFGAILFSLWTIVWLNILHKHYPAAVQPFNLTCACLSVGGYIGVCIILVGRAM